MHKLIIIFSLAFACLFTAKAQTAVSLFWRSDSTQVSSLSATDNKQYTKVGHHGPAVENSHMALRIYFNDSGAIDVYSKSGRQMELSKYLWYPTESQQADEGAGCDEYYCGKTQGLGGIALWDGEKVIPLAMTSKRVARVGKTAAGHFAEVASYGILYKQDTVDIALRIDVIDNSREAIVTGRCLNGKTVRFVTGINYNKGAKVKQGSGWISAWGTHPANVSQSPVPIGGGMAYDPDIFESVEKTENMVRLISKPVTAVNTRVVSASVKEDGLNNASKFEKYVKSMQAPLPLPLRFVLTGDSTCTNAKPKRGTHRGWGQALPFWFERDGLEICNFAVSGTSIKSFVTHGHWAEAQKKFKAGAVVTVSFGINDSYHKKTDPDRFTPDADFADSLRSYVSVIRAGGCTPLFITPLCGRKFENGEFVVEKNRKGKAEIVEAVGKELGVTVVDGIGLSAEWIRSMGDERSKDCFCWFGPGIYKDSKSKEGRKDNTHLNQYGAYKYSRILAEEFMKLYPELAPFLRDAKYWELEAEFGPIPVWSIQ